MDSACVRFYIFEILQLYLTLKFKVWIKWKDTRLQYEDLKTHHFKNSIRENVALKLWKPALLFENHRERDNEKQVLKYSPLPSIMMLVKNGHGKEAPISQIYETKLYSPNETELLWRSRHYMRFRCDFNLFYFPFDHQTCYVRVGSKHHGFRALSTVCGFNRIIVVLFSYRNHLGLVYSLGLEIINMVHYMLKKIKSNKMS